MRGSEFDFLLMNLQKMCSPSGIYHIPQAEALSRLRTLTGQDFGFDVLRWAEYGRVKGLCSIRWDEWLLSNLGEEK